MEAVLLRVSFQGVMFEPLILLPQDLALSLLISIIIFALESPDLDRFVPLPKGFGRVKVQPLFRLEALLPVGVAQLHFHTSDGAHM